MSGFGGWMEGLAPLIQNLSNTYGSGRDAYNTRASDDQGRRWQDALNIPRFEMASRIEGAKAAGLHPLAALGVNVGNYSSTVGAPETQGVAHAMGSYNRNSNADLERRLIQAQVKAAESDADVTVAQNNQALRNLAAQPGNRPAAITEVVPRRVTASIPGQPSQAGGVAPTQAGYAVTDAWTGKPRVAQMPTDEYGQGIENIGELWQAVLGTPYALDVLYQKYLQTPREWLTDRMGEFPSRVVTVPEIVRKSIWAKMKKNVKGSIYENVGY